LLREIVDGAKLPALAALYSINPKVAMRVSKATRSKTLAKTVAGSALGWKVRVQLTVEARNAKRHAWLENFRAPRGMASRRSALKKAQIARQESMKKRRCRSIQTMKFLGSSNEIHSS